MIKQKSMSLLASDLTGNIKFDVTQTLPALDVKSDEYNTGLGVYLRQFNISSIDKYYNEQVNIFEHQLEEQELAAKLEANALSEASSNARVEAQPGLSTGATAIAADTEQKLLGESHAAIEQQTEELYKTGIEEISKEYQATLESVLGEYDPATGTFTGIAQYQQLSNLTSEATMRVLAKMLGADVNDQGDGYTEVLQNAGYLTKENGEYIITEAGEEAIDRLVNGADANEVNPVLGEPLMAALAEQMAITAEPSWSSISDEKKIEIRREYESFIYNNLNGLRVSAWGLYSLDNGLELDTFWSSPKLTDTDLYQEGVNTDNGISVFKLTLNDVQSETETQDRLDQIKNDIISGKIPDGAYITFSTGEAESDDKFYYVYNDTVYETSYTQSNPPPRITLESATVYSFGDFADVGLGGGDEQDEWVNKIIAAAKAGKIPEGTYMDMNYGHAAAGEAWYKYENGTFIRVNKSDVPIIMQNGVDEYYDAIYVHHGLDGLQSREQSNNTDIIGW